MNRFCHSYSTGSSVSLIISSTLKNSPYNNNSFFKLNFNSSIIKLQSQRKLHFARHFKPTTTFSNTITTRHFSLTTKRITTRTNFTRKMSTKTPLSEEKNPSTSSHSHSHSNTEGHHSHSHSHSGSGMLHHHKHSMHEPNELLAADASAIKTNPAVRITWIGLLVNVTLAISKGIGGVYFHSQALVADAIHSVSDMLADFLTLATVNVASKVGTPTKFPLGYGKLETVGAFLVSVILLFAGVSVGWSSLLQIFEFVLPTHLYEIVSAIHIGHDHSHTNLGGSNSGGHSHTHAHVPADDAVGVGADLTTHREIPNINAAWLAAGSIIAKEILYRKTMKVAVETNSKVLVANAWHHRVDSLTAVVALLTVTGGVLFNVAWLDSIGGIAVSILIIRAGWDSMKEAWYELIDRGEEPGSELYNKVEGIIKNELEMNKSLEQFKLNQLSVLSSGANTNIYCKLTTTNKNLDLITLNQYEKKLSDLIREDDRFVRNIYIKFENVNEQPKEHEEEEEEEDYEKEKEHEHEHVHVHTHKH